MLLVTLFLGILLSYSQCGVNGANILAIMDAASPSHSLWNQVLINALAAKGHNITLITADLPKKPKDFHKNVRYVHLENIYDTLRATAGTAIKDFINVSPLEMVSVYIYYSVGNCQGSVTSKGFKEFMEKYKNEKYDLVLHDYTFGPCLLALLHVYNYPPLVSVSSFPYQPIANKFNGGHYYPSYITYHSSVLDPKNSFIDRMYNHILYIAEEFMKDYVMIPKMDEIIKPYFPKDTPKLADLEKLSTIALVGSHPAITNGQATPSNVIEIGGLNLVDPEPLPKDIDDFINQSKKGAVLFSLGTNMRPKDVSSELVENILNVFEKFPEYNFLWKFETEFIKRKIPKNVLIQSFYPQRDILAHKKTKAFITHAGGLSTQESIWYGVPMITVPLFADQIRNSHIVAMEGIAVQVKFFTMNDKNLNEALNEVLNNPKYRNKMELVSRRFRDRPMKPLDTAIWWIEYILRDPKPDHLKLPTIEMGFIRANSIDFIFLVFISLTLIVYIIVKIIKCLCCRKDSATKVSDKKLKKKVI